MFWHVINTLVVIAPLTFIFLDMRMWMRLRHGMPGVEQVVKKLRVMHDVLCYMLGVAFHLRMLMKKRFPMLMKVMNYTFWVFSQVWVVMKKPMLAEVHDYRMMVCSMMFSMVSVVGVQQSVNELWVVCYVLSDKLWLAFHLWVLLEKL